MFPWINLYLLLYSLPLAGPHHNELAYGHHYLNYLTMSSDNSGQNADSGAPLSNTDLAKYLINDSFTRVRELRQEIKEDFDADREHNRKVIRTVVTGICKRLDTLEGLARGKADTTEAVKDLDLKLTTITTYNEELIHGLLQKVHDLSNKLEQHAQPLQLIKCGFCGSSFNSSPDLDVHIHQHHTQLNTLLCTGCGYVFLNDNDLRTHQCGSSHYMQDYSTTLCQEYPVNTLNPQVLHLNVHTAPQHHGLGSLYCYKCGQIFHGEDDLNLHVETHHGPSNFMCDVCGIIFCTESLASEHIAMSHQSSNHELHCSYCDQTFDSMYNLNCHLKSMHIQENPNNKVTNEVIPHVTSANAYCDECEYACLDTDHLKTHANIHHTEGTLESCSSFDTSSGSPFFSADSPMIQVDGNTSLSNLSDSATVSAEITVPTPNQSAASTQYNYNLNSYNQARRIFENSLRPPLEIRYNSYKQVNGEKHPTNVSIDCNAGVYFSAVKPALESITEGWQTCILSTDIACEEISDRQDISGRKVHTKLVLYLTERHSPDKRAKVVVHFYHTSNSVQVQGSTIMSNGSSSPVWLVTNFLQPLADNHTANQTDSIQVINQNIQQSSPSVYICSSCNSPINSAAPNPKDQELSCSKCGNFFHKKCTDRKRTTANWKKTPWYCCECIKGTSTTHSNEIHSASELSASYLDHGGYTFTPASARPISSVHHLSVSTPQSSTVPVANTQASIPDSNTVGARSITHVPATTHHRGSSSQVSESHAMSTTASGTFPLTTLSIITVPSTTASATGPPSMASCSTTQSSTSTPSVPMPRFPSTNTRQRSSNVNLTNAEAEFNKTALGACRSTISQQEMEIKRLNESIELRNKRISQLECQVGYAGDMLASRETARDIPEDRIKIVVEKINELSVKVEKLSLTTTANNIVINPCSRTSQPRLQDSSAQTDYTGVSPPHRDLLVQQVGDQREEQHDMDEHDDSHGGHLHSDSQEMDEHDGRHDLDQHDGDHDQDQHEGGNPMGSNNGQLPSDQPSL